VLACLDYNSSRSFTKFEFDFLILCVFLSAVCLCFADDFLIFYLAIEFQSLAFYILSTFDRNSEFSTEAGLKYFVFGAVFSCFLLIGFALIFLAFGSASFELLFSLVLSHDDPFFFSGVIFLTFALLFKVGSAPFHF
jgi:NADH-quinone oxidoreductase subunit N